MKRGNEKKGQVTIFIIIAIIIVILAFLIYLFYPSIKSSILGSENPSDFIQNCLEDEIQENVELLSVQGGSLDPEHYILYNGEKIEYLCYTEEYYKTCVMQQPMLKKHVEDEIKENIETSARECLNSLEESYEKKGYSVNLNKKDFFVELLPKRIVVDFNSSLTLTKAGETEKYNSLKVILNNNIYELISITNSILNWEARYGDAETTTYMNYYHDLKVEKKKQSDGSTIYILTDRNNLNKFQFASRSLAWPPGDGAENLI